MSASRSIGQGTRALPIEEIAKLPYGLLKTVTAAVCAFSECRLGRDETYDEIVILERNRRNGPDACNEEMPHGSLAYRTARSSCDSIRSAPRPALRRAKPLARVQETSYEFPRGARGQVTKAAQLGWHTDGVASVSVFSSPGSVPTFLGPGVPSIYVNWYVLRKREAPSDAVTGLGAAIDRMSASPSCLDLILSPYGHTRTEFG
jgi:hypothetical protein